MPNRKTTTYGRHYKMPMYWRFGLRISEVSDLAVAFVIAFLFLLNRTGELVNNIVAIATFRPPVRSEYMLFHRKSNKYSFI